MVKHVSLFEGNLLTRNPGDVYFMFIVAFTDLCKTHAPNRRKGMDNIHKEHWHEWHQDEDDARPMRKDSNDDNAAGSYGAARTFIADTAFNIPSLAIPVYGWSPVCRYYVSSPARSYTEYVREYIMSPSTALGKPCHRKQKRVCVLGHGGCVSEVATTPPFLALSISTQSFHGQWSSDWEHVTVADVVELFAVYRFGGAGNGFQGGVFEGKDMVDGSSRYGKRQWELLVACGA
ncbi:hypothetical protein EDD85DRAFT_797566 [Armillaria nabsnona]|nr:hypothetical protein EDD85DRAFT_797566 [Armillaria nabsnona]